MKKILSLVLVGLMTMSFAGCGTTNNEEINDLDDSNPQVEQQDGDELENQQTDGVLRVGTEAQYAPYEFIIVDENGQNQFVGFDMDLARDIAADLNKELVLVDLPFDSLMLEMKAGNIDMAIAGLSPKPERAEVADFSQIYYNAQQSVVVRTEDFDKYTDETSFAGLQVAAQNGSIQADYVNSTMEGAVLVGYSTIPEMILEMQAGNVTAMVIEEPVINALLQTNPELKVLYTFIDPESEGNVVCVPKGNTELLDQVNSTITRVIQDGTMNSYVVEAFSLMSENIG